MDRKYFITLTLLAFFIGFTVGSIFTERTTKEISVTYEKAPEQTYEQAVPWTENQDFLLIEEEDEEENKPMQQEFLIYPDDLLEKTETM